MTKALKIRRHKLLLRGCITVVLTLSVAFVVRKLSRRPFSFLRRIEVHPRVIPHLYHSVVFPEIDFDFLSNHRFL